jgi:hypothetical protein
MECTVTTGSENYTKYFEDGEEVWPCRCGETHRGDYGFYDFIHHNCDHDDIVVVHDFSFGYCGGCGKTINILDRRVED